MNSALEMITLVDTDGLRMPTPAGRLPIHLAIANGKTWKELRTMVELAPETLLIVDPYTGLLPYQQVACKDSYLPRHEIVRSVRANSLWEEASPEENARTILSICRDYELEKLTTIFEILRSKASSSSLSQQRRSSF
jgi:hypothetical protein